MILQLNYDVRFFSAAKLQETMAVKSLLLERSAVNRASLMRKMIQDRRGQYRGSTTSLQGPLLPEN